jgi:hypothetical protein
LRLERAGDYYYSVAQRFTASFIKKGNISEEKIGRVAMRFRFRAPLATNPRMENLFERASFSRVGKDYMAKLLSIQLLIDRKNRTPKFASNLSFNLQIKISKLMRGLIRVEKLGGRKDLAQAFAKAGLACGNSAGDPDDRHDSGT